VRLRICIATVAVLLLLGAYSRCLCAVVNATTTLLCGGERVGTGVKERQARWSTEGQSQVERNTNRVQDAM
jgi:hypothetical protein